MALFKCQSCGALCHLRITDPESAKIVTPNLCFECWKELKEYEVVEVLHQNPSVPEAVVGDIGAVVLVLESPEGKKAYEVECVLASGETKWVGSFERNQLKFRR